MLALAASALLLAGCAATPVVPPGITTEEFEAIIDQQNAGWWESIAPGEPRPVIEPIEYLQLGEESALVQQCILDANIDGVTESPGGSINFNYDPADPKSNNAFDRANYICAMQYPYDRSDPAAMGYFSEAQLGYLYDYFAERSVPCLRMLGYSVSDPPDRQQFVDKFYVNGWWMPYYELTPGMDERGWQQVQLHCPAPALIGEWYRPFG